MPLKYTAFFLLMGTSCLSYSQKLHLDWMAEYPDTRDQKLGKIVKDSNKDVYVCGSIIKPGTFKAFLTMKYDSLGALVWSNEFDDPFADNLNDCELLGDNLVVAGNTGESIGSPPARTILIKYKENGDLLWQKSLFDSTQFGSGLFRIETDGNGSIYAFGSVKKYPYIAGSKTEMYVSKIDSGTGEIIWTYISKTGTTAFDGVPLSDRVRVFGSNGTTYFVQDISHDGDSIGLTFFPGQNELWENYFIDNEGNLIVTGKSVSKMSHTGDTIWTLGFTQNQPNYVGSAVKATSDEAGNILVTGWLQDTITKTNYTQTIFIKKNGEVLWFKSDHIDDNSISEGGYTISINEDYVFVASMIWYGEFPNFLTDIRLILYNINNGDFLADTLIDLNVNEEVDYSYSDGQHFYISGTNANSSNDISDLFLMRFSVEQSTNSSWQKQTNNKLAITPNPFTGTIYLTIDSFEEIDVDFEILNTTGQRVYHSQESLRPGVNHLQTRNLEHLPGGIYFVSVRNRKEIFTKKAIKLK